MDEIVWKNREEADIKMYLKETEGGGWIGFVWFWINIDQLYAEIKNNIQHVNISLISFTFHYHLFDLRPVFQ
jgi:hypothetical protein